MRERNGNPTRLEAAILDEAVKALERGGEAALRVHDVATRAGCSVALIYRHFGNREGLIEAAMLERLRRFSVVDNRALMEMAQSSPDIETFVRRHGTFAREVFGGGRARNRQFVAEFISTSRSRPELRTAFVAQQRETQRAFADVVRAGQRTGLFRDDIPAAAIANFARAYTFGRILADIDPGTSGSLEDWIRCVDGFLLSLGVAAAKGRASGRRPARTESVGRRRAAVGSSGRTLEDGAGNLRRASRRGSN